MTQSYTGSFLRGASGSDYATIDFIVRRVLSRSATNTLVQVKDVHPGTGSVGFVDVQPMIHQLDGSGSVTPHGTVYHLPYFRLQGGTCAIILDPVVGDIGIACFAAEDISSAKNNRAPSNPGSRRRFSMADGLYLGGFLNATPTQFIQFDPANGITITSASGNPVTINAPGGCTINTNSAAIEASDSVAITSPSVSMSGDLSISGTTTTNGLTATGSVSLDSATVSGAITASTITGTSDVVGGGKSLKTHTHGGVQTGSGTSGPPS